jgi:5-methylcytosine-specific restriction endonuclease McrA
MSRWFRVYDNLVEDPKVQRLPDALFRGLVNLWCLASQGDGLLPTVGDIAFKLRIKPSQAQKLLADLRNAGLIVDDETGTHPHNWSGRQFVSDGSSERVQRYRDKRKASGLPTLGDYTKFKPALIERDGDRCVYCETTGRMVVDHMVPIALGGTDHEDNLALACRPCNSGKSGRTPELANMTIRVTSAAIALRRYRDSHAGVTVTATPPETETETEQIQKDSEANASGADAPIDHRKRLFNEGLKKLATMTGKGPDACRSFVGKCLKASGDDAITVLGLIEDAERNQVVNPSSWIVARLKPTEFSNGTNQTGGSLTASIRRELAALEQSESADLALPAGRVLRLSN